MTELLINGTDASLYGIRTGKGFTDTLLSPVPLKEFVSNESRLEDGVRVVVPAVPKFAAWEFSLQFQITGTDAEDFAAKRDAFFALLYSGRITLSVPQKSGSVFRLIYMGSSPAYRGGLYGNACKVTVKFMEPDPSDRGI